MVTAHLRDIVVYPLKSAGAQHLSSALAEASGLVGDRRWAVMVREQVVRAKTVPQLADLAVRVSDDQLELDDGSGFAPAEQVVARLVPGGIVVDDAGGHRMVAPVHLISQGADRAADAPAGCDPNPRANLVLDGLTPGIERSWIGESIRIGEVELRIAELPRHCLGVYAEVVRGGVLRVGDPVLLSSA